MASASPSKWETWLASFGHPTNPAGLHFPASNKTVIFVKKRFGIKIITCWKSSGWERKAFDEEAKK